MKIGDWRLKISGLSGFSLPVPKGNARRNIAAPRSTELARRGASNRYYLTDQCTIFILYVCVDEPSSALTVMIQGLPFNSPGVTVISVSSS